MIYLAGYALQMSGENFFVPVDATLMHGTDLPVEALRPAAFSPRPRQKKSKRAGSST